MSERPELNRELDGKTFRSYYYLKEELVDFCRENNLPLSDSGREEKGKTTIDKQFEYNTYICDFFEDNQGRSLEEAIIC